MDYNTNVARKLTVPQHSEHVETQSQPVFKPVAFSKFEYLLTTCCALVICAMMVTLVSSKISVNNSQRHLQDVQSKIS